MNSCPAMVHCRGFLSYAQWKVCNLAPPNGRAKGPETVLYGDGGGESTGLVYSTKVKI